MTHTTFDEKIIDVAENIFYEHGTTIGKARVLYQRQGQEQIKAALREIKSTFSYVSSQHLCKVLRLPKTSFDRMNEATGQEGRARSVAGVRDRATVNI